MAKSIMQKDKECYLTKSKIRLHKHHIYMGPYRQKSEKYGCWVWLRADWHNMADYGVHFNHELDMRLKKECQRRFEDIHGHEKFMELFKKNYI